MGRVSVGRYVGMFFGVSTHTGTPPPAPRLGGYLVSFSLGFSNLGCRENAGICDTSCNA